MAPDHYRGWPEADIAADQALRAAHADMISEPAPTVGVGLSGSQLSGKWIETQIAGLNRAYARMLTLTLTQAA